MLIHPWDAGDVEEAWSFVCAQGFGQLIAAGRDRDVPVVVATQYVLTGGGSQRQVLLHLARPNPIWAAIAENPRVVLAVAGDWAYLPVTRPYSTIRMTSCMSCASSWVPLNQEAASPTRRCTRVGLPGFEHCALPSRTSAASSSTAATSTTSTGPRSRSGSRRAAVPGMPLRWRTWCAEAQSCHRRDRGDSHADALKLSAG